MACAAGSTSWSGTDGYTSFRRTGSAFRLALPAILGCVRQAVARVPLPMTHCLRAHDALHRLRNICAGPHVGEDVMLSNLTMMKLTPAGARGGL